jgi:hypothetical protein
MSQLYVPSRAGAAFVDGNGHVYPGGLLNFYATGTTTRQPTYTDSALTVTATNPVVADANGLFAAIYLDDSLTYKVVFTTAAGTTVWTTDPIGSSANSSTVLALRNYLSGLTLSTAGSSPTFSVAVGQAADVGSNIIMSLTGALSKTTSAWSAGSGNGALDTGAIANSTWYHVFLIQNFSTSNVDLLLSLSAVSPTLPANYTRYRRIGSIRTDGSAHWISFIQDGDLFQWLTPTVDVSVNTPGTSAVTRSLTNIPLGVNVLANLQVLQGNSSTTNGNLATYVSDLATTDMTPTTGGTVLSDFPSGGVVAGDVFVAGTRISVRTNTSQQIRTRQSIGDAFVGLTINTLGWTDPRGKNA